MRYRSAMTSSGNCIARRWSQALRISALALFLSITDASGALELSESIVPAEIPDFSISNGPRTLRLPEGVWWELDHYVWQATAGTAVGRVDSAFIARIEHGTIGLAGRIVLLKYDIPAKSWRDEPCGGVEDIYAKEYSTSYDLKDCLVVRSERSKDMSDLLKRTFPKVGPWVAAHGMTLPDAAVRIRYARYSTNTYGILDLFVEHRQDEATLPPLPELPTAIPPAPGGRGE